MTAFEQFLAKWQPTALSLFRFITGLLLFQYGMAKILKFDFPSTSPYAFLNKVELMSLSGAAGAIELILRRSLAARAVHAARRLHSFR